MAQGLLLSGKGEAPTHGPRIREALSAARMEGRMIRTESRPFTLAFVSLAQRAARACRALRGWSLAILIVLAFAAVAQPAIVSERCALGEDRVNSGEQAAKRSAQQKQVV